MANKRIFQCQALVSNGIAIGGLANIGFDAAFAEIVESVTDGAAGAEDVDIAGLRVAAAMQCTDVTKVNALLAAAVGNTTFSGHEAGAATYHNYTVRNILWNAMNLNLARGADGSLQCNGALRFEDGTKKLEDVIQLTGAQAAPSLTYPARLYRPNTASFDPDGADPAIAPLHVGSIGLSLSGGVIEDFGDTDVGHTSLDFTGWNALKVTMVHRDSTPVSTGDISASLVAAVKGVLTVQLLGRGGAADQTLTINNLKWHGSSEEHGQGYTDYTLTGTAGWKNGATTYTMNGGTKLFSFV